MEWSAFMNILLVGSGGREHALAWKLAQSPRLTRLFIAPGNPGTALHGRNIPINADSVSMLVNVARRERIDLVVVGPEAPLAAGLADACIAAGIKVFGPTAAAARIESSKAFAKQLMIDIGVPTPGSHVFDDPAAASEFVQISNRPWVVKADGLAAGKGVIVNDTVATTVAAIEQIGRTGAGHRILLEERLFGTEVSLIALCDGERLLPLPPAQDHKRLHNGNTGPNTGGMGAFAPSPLLGDELIALVVHDMMLPVVQALADAGTPFRGALYAGLMLTNHGPQVLEFNARFGDPETQAILPLVGGDLLAALLACAEGRLDPEMLNWRAGAAACVVLAAEGYPGTPRRNDPIAGIEAAEDPNVHLFHAGTTWQDGRLVTAGGRVLGVTGLGPNLRSAIERAYATIENLCFPGMQYRTDIGKGLGAQ
jgi:phosphoribosylamine--glycine ligase